MVLYSVYHQCRNLYSIYSFSGKKIHLKFLNRQIIIRWIGSLMHYALACVLLGILNLILFNICITYAFHNQSRHIHIADYVHSIALCLDLSLSSWKEGYWWTVKWSIFEININVYKCVYLPLLFWLFIYL